jgi:hypothetical protein
MAAAGIVEVRTEVVGLLARIPPVVVHLGEPHQEIAGGLLWSGTSRPVRA